MVALNHNNLKELRAKALLSKAELARKDDVSVLTISRIEVTFPPKTRALVLRVSC